MSIIIQTPAFYYDILVEKYHELITNTIIDYARENKKQCFVNFDLNDFITYNNMNPLDNTRMMILLIEDELKWSLLHYLVHSAQYSDIDKVELKYAVWDTSPTIHFTWKLKK